MKNKDLLLAFLFWGRLLTKDIAKAFAEKTEPISSTETQRAEIKWRKINGGGVNPWGTRLTSMEKSELIWVCGITRPAGLKDQR